MSASPNPPVSRRPAATLSRGRDRGRRVAFWIAIAALIHAELALLIGFGLYALAPRDADLKRDLAARAANQPESIDIGMVDEEAAREIIADLDRQAEKKKAEDIKKQVESIHPDGQVVDVPAPRDEKRPDDARFVSEHDTTVPKETKKYGKFDQKAREGDASGAAEQSTPKSAAQQPIDRRLAMREPQLNRNSPQRSLTPRSLGAAGRAERRALRRAVAGAAVAGRGASRSSARCSSSSLAVAGPRAARRR